MTKFLLLSAIVALLTTLSCSDSSRAGASTSSETTNVIQVSQTSPTSAVPTKTPSLYRWVFAIDDQDSLVLELKADKVTLENLQNIQNWSILFTNAQKEQETISLANAELLRFVVSEQENGDYSLSWDLKFQGSEIKLDVSIDSTPATSSSISSSSSEAENGNPSSSSFAEPSSSSSVGSSASSGNMGNAWEIGTINFEQAIVYGGCTGAVDGALTSEECMNTAATTACTNQLQILCLVTEDWNRPDYLGQGTEREGWNMAQANAWGGGVYAVTTEKVLGTSLVDLLTGDQLCQAEFGNTAQMARNNFGRYHVDLMTGAPSGAEFATLVESLPTANSGAWFSMINGVADALNYSNQKYWVADLVNQGNCWDN